MAIDNKLYEKTKQDLERFAKETGDRRATEALQIFKTPDFAHVMITDAGGDEFRRRQSVHDENFNRLLQSIDACILSHDPKDRDRVVPMIKEWETKKNDATYQENLKSGEIYMPNTILKTQFDNMIKDTASDVASLLKSKQTYGESSSAGVATDRYAIMCNDVIERLNKLVALADSTEIPDTEDAREELEKIKAEIGLIRGWIADGSAQMRNINASFDKAEKMLRGLPKKTGKPLKEKSKELNSFPRVSANPTQKEIDQVDELAAALFVYDMVGYQQVFFAEKEEELDRYFKIFDPEQDKTLLEWKKQLIQLRKLLDSTSKSSPFYEVHARNYNMLAESYKKRSISLKNEANRRLNNQKNVRTISGYLDQFKRICDQLVDRNMGSYKDRCKDMILHKFVDLNEKYNKLIEVLRNGTEEEKIEFMAEFNAAIKMLTKVFDDYTETPIEVQDTYIDEDEDRVSEPIELISFEELGITEDEEEEPDREKTPYTPIGEDPQREKDPAIPDNSAVTEVNSDDVSELATLQRLKDGIKDGK